jgi:hypothetical protein
MTQLVVPAVNRCYIGGHLLPGVASLCLPLRIGIPLGILQTYKQHTKKIHCLNILYLPNGEESEAALSGSNVGGALYDCYGQGKVIRLVFCGLCALFNFTGY